MQAVKVIQAADLEENGGTFKVQGGPVLRVRGHVAGDVSAEGGTPVAVYVMDAGQITTENRKIVGGQVINMAAVTRTPAGNVAIPVYIVDGAFS